jgi:hypothetical protein
MDGLSGSESGLWTSGFEEAVCGATVPLDFAA